MKFIVLGVALLAVSINAKASFPTGVGYYWRDYDGTHLPYDAYEFAPNSYIAQVHAFGALIPGHFYKKSGFVEFVHNNQPFSSDQHLKILCTSDTTQFEWIRANSHNVRNFMAKKFFVRGGVDPNVAQKSIIGRTSDTSVAGVIYFMKEPALLEYVYNGLPKQADEFEVLAIH